MYAEEDRAPKSPENYILLAPWFTWYVYLWRRTQPCIGTLLKPQTFSCRRTTPKLSRTVFHRAKIRKSFHVTRSSCSHNEARLPLPSWALLQYIRVLQLVCSLQLVRMHNNCQQHEKVDCNSSVIFNSFVHCTEKTQAYCELRTYVLHENSFRNHQANYKLQTSCTRAIRIIHAYYELQSSFKLHIDCTNFQRTDWSVKL